MKLLKSMVIFCVIYVIYVCNICNLINVYQCMVFPRNVTIYSSTISSYSVNKSPSKLCLKNIDYVNRSIVSIEQVPNGLFQPLYVLEIYRKKVYYPNFFDFNNDLISIIFKRGSRGAARAAKSMRWSG